MQPSSFTFAVVENGPFHEKVKRLAARLGVDPAEESKEFRTFVDAGDCRFDLLDLMHAFLDKIDAAEKATHKPITHF